MTLRPYLAVKTALGATAIALSMNAVAIAAPTSGVAHRLQSLAPRAAASRGVNILHAFSGADGSAPEGNLDLALSYSNNRLIRTIFGETEGGGSALSGTIFAYTIGSALFGSVYNFSGGNDGGVPLEGLANNESQYFQAGNTQLGIAISGGADGDGTLFATAKNGPPFAVHTFSGGADGAFPAGRLTQFTDGNYYGTTSGGASGYGTVYRVTSSGVFSTIYTFTGGADGGSPQAGLALRVDRGGKANSARTGPLSAVVDRMIPSENKQYVSPYLYGTTSTGAAGGSGTIFRITPAGQLQTLHTFSGGADGAVPTAKLSTDLNGNLYGTTSVGGSAGNGVVFKIARGGTTSKVIYDFGNGATGASPSAQLTVAFNGAIYGTTTSGGASGQFGTVFEITSGGTFSDIHDFKGTDGATPQGALLDGGDNYLYGTTTAGGAMSSGVLFSIAE